MLSCCTFVPSIIVKSEKGESGCIDPGTEAAKEVIIHTCAGGVVKRILDPECFRQTRPFSFNEDGLEAFTPLVLTFRG